MGVGDVGRGTPPEGKSLKILAALSAVNLIEGLHLTDKAGKSKALERALVTAYGERLCRAGVFTNQADYDATYVAVLDAIKSPSTGMGPPAMYEARNVLQLANGAADNMSAIMGVTGYIRGHREGSAKLFHDLFNNYKVTGASEFLCVRRVWAGRLREQVRQADAHVTAWAA
jgi:hypothetical protein